MLSCLRQRRKARTSSADSSTERDERQPATAVDEQRQRMILQIDDTVTKMLGKMLLAVRAYTALTDELCILQQLAQHDRLIAEIIRISEEIVHDLKAQLIPARKRDHMQPYAEGERQGSTEQFLFLSKTEPTSTGGKEQ